MKHLVNNFRKFKIITFDVTNTLLYFKKPPEIIYLDYAVKYGLKYGDFDKDLMKMNFRRKFKELNKLHGNFGQKTGFGYENWWKELVVGVFEDSLQPQVHIERSKLDNIAENLIQAYTTDECWGKFHKSDELIRELRAVGKCVGVISNFDPRLHQLLRNVKLPPFDFVQTSYEAKHEKPKKEIFETAIKLAEIYCEPHEAIHIGNEDKDYDGAKGAGWSAILINSDEKSKSQFKDIQDFYTTITTKIIDIK
jgi:REG-2-like HAD superfamily hydrolase